MGHPKHYLGYLTEPSLPKAAIARRLGESVCSGQVPGGVRGPGCVGAGPRA